MRSSPLELVRHASLSLVLAVATASSIHAQSRIVLPAGTVIIVRTTTPLQSATAQAGQTFETTVDESVGVDEYAVIPAGSKIRGVISVATPATRQQSGVIEVSFDRLTLADGSVVPITGKLTSTDTAERRQIKSNPNAHVVLVGARGGLGASIAGAGSGTGANNILAALGSMLSEGRDVSLVAGTPMAVEVENAVSLRSGSRLRGAGGSTILTAPDRVRAAQQALANQNYYRGSINGTLDDATRRALFAYQIDKGLNGTGNLDGRTAQALGINTATDGVVGSGGTTVMSMSPDAASVLRRDAQNLVARDRAEIGIATNGRMDPSRAYAQGDLDLLFALSAFADNASVHEQLVRTGGNALAIELAGRSIVAAARRVDAAFSSARTSGQLQNAWVLVRRQLAVIDPAMGG
jgi:Putative peptidoglycan binding domain